MVAHRPAQQTQLLILESLHPTRSEIDHPSRKVGRNAIHTTQATTTLGPTPRN